MPASTTESVSTTPPAMAIARPGIAAARARLVIWALRCRFAFRGHEGDADAPTHAPAGVLIKTGTLELINAHGSRYFFGAAPGPAVVARIHDSALHIRLALNPELAAAEAYMDGTLTFEGGSTAHDLLLLFSVNRSALGAVASQKLLR
jgi:hypothetical protein